MAAAVTVSKLIFLFSVPCNLHHRQNSVEAVISCFEKLQTGFFFAAFLTLRESIFIAIFTGPGSRSKAGDVRGQESFDQEGGCLHFRLRW